MNPGNPMTLTSQLSMGAVGALGILVMLWLLRKRRLNESLFYFWLAIFLGIIAVGISNRLQITLTRVIGAYDPISAMLLLALGFLFGAAMVYSVLISGLNAKIRDLTTYVAELRLDVDDLAAPAVHPETGTKGPAGHSGE
jgi:hypothetical protein